MTKVSIVILGLFLSACAHIRPGPDPQVAAVKSASVGAHLSNNPAGGLNQDVTQTSIRRTICVPGWTATVRPSSNYTNALKLKLLRAAGLPDSDSSKYELDHFVPLAIGGHPRDPNNLWLQPWEGEWGAKTKDQLERKLQKLVCAGHLMLAEAQQAIRSDWIGAYKRYVTKAEALAPGEVVD